MDFIVHGRKSTCMNLILNSDSVYYQFSISHFCSLFMILAALCENPSITNDIFSFTFIINITKATYIIMYLQIWSLYFSYSNHYLSVSCIHLQILSVTENPREVESSIVFG